MNSSDATALATPTSTLLWTGRWEPPQRLRERQPQDGQQDHALGGTEAAAVDAGQERAADRAHVVVALGAVLRRGLEPHQRHREQDQDRDHGVEHGARQLEQQDAARERADRGAARGSITRCFWPRSSRR